MLRALKSAALKRQFYCSASNTQADSKGRGSEKRPYNKLPELHFSWHKCCVVMVVFDGLRSTLIWPKFQNFPGGACPPDPPRMLCALPTAPPATQCECLPLFNLLICPWHKKTVEDIYLKFLPKAVPLKLETTTASASCCTSPSRIFRQNWSTSPSKTDTACLVTPTVTLVAEIAVITT